MRMRAFNKTWVVVSVSDNDDVRKYVTVASS